MGYGLTHQLSDAVQVRQGLRYLDYSVDGPIVYYPGGTSPTSLARDYFTYRGDFGVLSLDNQVEGRFRTGQVEHRVLAGVELVDYRASSKGDLFNLQPINPFAPTYGGGATAAGPFFSSREVLKQAGVYAQYRARVAERVVLTAGLRYSDVRDRVTDRLGASTTRQNDTETSLTAGAVWLLPSGFTPYVSYAESFEPQVGYDPLLSGETPAPSLGRQYEAGLGWRSADARVEVKAAGFQITQTNIVNPDPANPGFSTLNGEQRHRGLDVELAVRVARALRLDAGYAYLDAEITKSTYGDQGAHPARTAGGAGGVAHRGAAPGVAAERAQRVSAAGVHGGGCGARWRLGPVTAAVDVQNLFNRRYYPGTFFGGAVIPGQPRMVVGSVRTRF
ncbi:MAG: TonB-dependent receptor [Gemmatimonadetes bacterium]|nr:TonB-dependent receptor [Gemmatimonadota bacterium]